MKRITNRHRRALMGPPPDPESVPTTTTRYERLKSAADALSEAAEETADELDKRAPGRSGSIIGNALRARVAAYREIAGD